MQCFVDWLLRQPAISSAILGISNVEMPTPTTLRGRHFQLVAVPIDFPAVIDFPVALRPYR
jgi:hypothetical protein